MKKVLTIIQIIIGVVVVYFALVLFYQALIQVIPALNIIAISPGFGLTGMNPWTQLILSIFILQVVVVYTKKIFDKLSVSN